MKTERMPWTCRWSEFRPATPAPMWMDSWMAQWACLAGQQRELSTSLDRCAECQKFETRAGHAGQPQRALEHQP